MEHLSRWRIPALCAALGLGALVLQQQPVLYSPVIYVPIPLLMVVGWCLRPSWLRSIVAMLLAFSLGFGWAHWRAELRLKDRLDPALEMQEVEVTGVVRGVPIVVPGIAGEGVRFRFSVEQAPPGVPSLLSLAWYARGLGSSAPTLVAGERWRLTVRLKRPHGAANPHGFNVERWMLEEGLRATGTVRVFPVPERLEAQTYGLGAQIDRLRQILAERLLSALASLPYAGVIAALVMGEQRYIAPDDWALFNRTGVGHLLSISGLHITMLAGCAAAFGWGVWRWAVRREHAWAMRRPGLRVATWVGLVAAFFYTLLAGFAVPAQRTLFMLLVVALAIWTGRSTRPLHVLGLALVVVVVLDPWAVGAAGFWLSFGAVACLMLTAPQSTATRWRDRLQWAIHAQLAVTLGLFSLSVWFFQQVSLVGPVANALAIPVVSFVVTPLALLGSAVLMLLGWSGLVELSHAVLAGLMHAIVWLGQWPWAALELPAPAAGWVVFGFLGACLVAAPRRSWWQRVLGVVMMLPLVWAPMVAADRIAWGNFQAIVLDVGQGGGTLVRTRQHALLYDAGPRWTEEADAGARIIVPYLRAVGLRRLDRVVVSHNDSDHAGGALSILKERQVAEVWGSLPEKHPIVQRASSYTSCNAGQQWEWDGVLFEILHPTPETQARNDNGRSCVLRVSAGQHSLLLTGDIESAQEQQMLGWLAENPQFERPGAGVVVAPHHGSKSSSSEAFIAGFTPQAVIMQSGYLNHFRHPRPEVIERYEKAGAKVWRTDLQGAVIVRVSPTNMSLEAERLVRPFYGYGR